MRIIRSFIAGMTAKTHMPMLFGILTAFLLLFGAEYALRSGLYTVIPEKYLSASATTDYSLHTSYRIGKLRRAAPEIPVVYIMGSSTGRAGFTEDVLTRDIALALGQKFMVYNLSLHGGTFIRDRVLLDNLPRPRDRAFLVLSIGPRRFDYTPYNPIVKGNEVFIVHAPYLDWSSEKLRYFFVLTPAANKFALYLKNQLRMLKKGSLAFEKTPENYFSGTATEEKAEKYIEEYKIAFPTLPYQRESTQIFTEFLDAALERGFIPVVVNMPLNHAYLKGRWDNTLLIYNKEFKEICATRNIPYLDYQNSLFYPADAFADIQHLNGKGRELFQKQFVEDMLAIISGEWRNLPARKLHEMQ